MGHDSPGLNQRKAQLRGRMLAARENLSDAERSRQDSARTDALIADLEARAARTIACYLSRIPEPATLDLVERLHRRGVRVLVPMLSRRRDGSARRDPDWAWYEGKERLRSGLWGIPEPNADGLGAEALGQAEVVLCSALAADKRGYRLGVGGGWHDRALLSASIDAERWVLLFDHELVDEVPVGPHDLRIDRIVTASGITEAAPEKTPKETPAGEHFPV